MYKNRIEAISEGCGKRTNMVSEFCYCEKGRLCSSCKAKLQIATELKQEELERIRIFKERNFDTLKQLCPREFEEDKLYEKGMKDVCKEQNLVLDKWIKQIEEELKLNSNGVSN